MGYLPPHQGFYQTADPAFSSWYVNQLSQAFVHGQREESLLTPSLKHLETNKAAILGWSGLSTSMESQIQPCWTQIGRFSKASDKENAITTEIFQKLAAANPMFTTSILHHELRNTVLKFKFAPDIISTSGKPNLGLGPMAFVSRDAGLVTASEREWEIIQAASSITPSALNNARMACPAPPSSVLELTTVLTLQLQFLQFLFGQTCPLAFQIQQVINQLHLNMDQLRAMPTFPSTGIPWILNAINRGTAAFFGMRCSDATQETQQLPWVDLTHCRTAINQCSFNADTPVPSFLLPPQQRKRPRSPNQQLQQTPRHPPRQTQQRQLPTAPPAQPRDSAVPLAIARIVDNWKRENPQQRLPPVSKLMTAVHQDKDSFPTQLGLTSRDCLRNAIYGSCNPNCTRNHKSIPLAAQDSAITILTEAFQNCT
jgi:hypothetical protein